MLHREAPSCLPFFLHITGTVSFVTASLLPSVCFIRFGVFKGHFKTQMVRRCSRRGPSSSHRSLMSAWCGSTLRLQEKTGTSDLFEQKKVLQQKLSKFMWTSVVLSQT